MAKKRYQCPICLRWYNSQQQVNLHTTGMVAKCKPPSKDDIKSVVVHPVTKKPLDSFQTVIVNEIDFTEVIKDMSDKKVLDPEPEKESYTCGNCKKDLGAVAPTFCPWCGAKLKRP